MALRRPPTTFSDEINAADLAANSVGASELADDAVDTAAIAANAVVTAKIADSTGAADGITTAKLATNAVTTAKITDANITTAKVADNAVTSAKVADATFTDNIEVKPHIIPGVLYPAIKDSGGTVRQVDGVTAVVASTTGPAGSTVASSLYGTVQSDGRMYYYTDIKGSKPIKDPRIGAHFGSQRHKFRSIQTLEQETATQGANVYSVDGRKWIRMSGTATTDIEIKNHGSGSGFVKLGNATDFIEITGYFIDVNILLETHPNYDGWTKQLNGGSASAGQSAVTANSPLTNRYVDASSVLNVGVGATLGINTVRINSHNDNIYVFGCELIAQDKFTDATCDTTNADATVTMDSTAKLSVGLSVSGTGITAGTTVASITNATTFELSANATAAGTNVTLTFGGNDISIPAQNVVSYGKKFAVSAASHHFNPFATNQLGAAVAIGNAGSHGKVTGGWSGTGATYYDSTLDTATSLGLAAWVNSGNYYRPINGGRVVKWIASDGTIKTSVNMMPPSAKAMGSHSGAATPHGTNWPATFIPVLSSGAVDHTQAEAAKTFFVSEYGNGEANGNTSYRDMTGRGSSGSTGFQNIAYVMDDGLTAMSAQNVAEWNTVGGSVYSQAQKPFFYTFIGTGISVESGHPAGTVHNIAQNLPYGTHILKIDTTSGHSTTTITLDGVQLNSSTTYFQYAAHGKLSFHQPKMPPIPEDATIIADYMLMADFVKQTDVEDTQISKGVRYCNGSRDHFYAGAAAAATTVSNHASGWHFRGLSGGSSPSGTGGNGVWRLPFFGTTGLSLMEDSAQAHSIKLGGAATTETALDYGTGAQGDAMSIAESVTLGQTEIETSLLQGSHHFYGHFVASPIHTSSHYQTFETTFLHELVGGDRNMEQNNLVVTADGKSWDEVTRDTSYLGKVCILCDASADQGSGFAKFKFTEMRGSGQAAPMGYVQKDIALAYDRFIILKAGEYFIQMQSLSSGNGWGQGRLWVNNTVMIVAENNSPGTVRSNLNCQISLNLQRGDYVQFDGQYIEGGADYQHHFEIQRLN